MAGLRVVRGGDWKWGEDQDGGVGYCGTTTGNRANPGWANILWDNGRKNDYRAGANDACDLLVLDNGPAGVFHPGVMCDVCDENNVKGLRWKCADCPDYDLCTECYGNNKHDLNHKFRRINTPNTTGDNVGRRQNAVRIQSRGLYTGATVIRGEDWDKNNQDGGAGSVGTVTKVGYVSEAGQDKAALVVRWPHDASTGYIYRRGLGGKVDVKYKSATAGWHYYRDHLPQLRDAQALATRTEKSGQAAQDEVAGMLGKLLLGAMKGGLDDDLSKMLSGGFQSEQKKETMRNFSVGDLVRLHHDLDVVKKLQDGHGSFNLLMVPALGKTGVITEIDDDGDVKVRFGGVEWILNPKAVTKQVVPKPAPQPVQQPPKPTPTVSNTLNAFKTGDRVVIAKPIDIVRTAQNKIGGWDDSLNPLIGTGVVGIVRDITKSNNLVVAFGEKTHILHPDICSDASKVKPINRVSQSDKFAVGEWVKLDRDIDFVKRRQKGHGGWNDSMKKAATVAGQVKAIDGDGDLKVDFWGNVWTVNPEVCCKSVPNEAVPPVTPPPENTKNTNKDHENLLVPDHAAAFRPGDYVTLDKDVDYVRRQQHGHGGWVDRMKQEMRKVGVVKEIDGDGDLKVSFDGGKPLTINPVVCHKAAAQESARPEPKPSPKVKDTNANIPPFAMDDQVEMIGNVDEIKRLQKNHGGWNEGMRNAMSLVGRVMMIDGDGDIKVNFSGKVWTLNPEVCRHSSGQSSSTASTEKRGKNVNEEASKRESRLSSGNPGTSAQGTSATGRKRTSGFSVNDQVKISVTMDKLKVIQRSHGGFNDKLAKAVGEIGILELIDDNGDLRVKFPQGTFTLNPEACMSLDSLQQKQQNTSPDYQTQNSQEFNSGDCVKMVLDVDVVIKLQDGHGGWNGAMALVIDKVGVVSKVLPNGDLCVTFGDNTWTFNPAIFMVVETGEGSRKMDRSTNSNRNSRNRLTSMVYECAICCERGVTIVFNCGHATCDQCSKQIEECPMCRQPIALRTKMFLT